MTSTPWGVSQTSKKHATGIVEYTTANHGGFHLSKTRQKSVPDCLRNKGGWYEEDCEWCKVVISFPELFEPKTLVSAYNTLKNWCHKAYEELTGVTLLPGESHAKDEELFFEAHKNDWIVISALRCKHDRSLIDVVASIGGKRRPWDSKTKRFVVSAADYEKRGHFGYVIPAGQKEIMR